CTTTVSCRQCPHARHGGGRPTRAPFSARPRETPASCGARCSAPQASRQIFSATRFARTNSVASKPDARHEWRLEPVRGYFHPCPVAAQLFHEWHPKTTQQRAVPLASGPPRGYLSWRVLIGAALWCRFEAERRLP